MLNDPGFEASKPNGTFPDSGPDSDPDSRYWQNSYAGGGADASCVANGVANHGGSNGLWAYTGTSADAWWCSPYQEFSSAAGKTYNASAWIRQPNSNPYGDHAHGWVDGSAAFVRLEFYNSNNTMLKRFDAPATLNGNNNRVTSDDQYWTESKITSAQAPPNTAKVRFCLVVQKPQKDTDIKSIACFDDCYLEEINRPPVAIIDSISPNPALEGEVVSFTGHGSDVDGTITNYSWSSSIDGVLSSQASFTTSNLSQGNHIISFMVRDNEGNWSAVVQDNLTVNNSPPVAIIDSITPRPAMEGERVSFSGHGEDAGAGTIVAHIWESSQDGQLSTQASFSTSSLSVGHHTISYKVQDNNGAWSEEARLALVVLNQPPTAIIDSISPNPAMEGEKVSFSGHGEDVGGISEYRWYSSIDGYLSGQASFATSNLSVGTHTIYFGVTDDYGSWSEEYAQMTLTIVNTPPTAYIDSISPDPAYEGDRVTITGHGEDIGGGTIVAYEWYQYHGYPPFATGTSCEYDCYFVGTRTIYFRVQDNNGAWSDYLPVNIVSNNVIPTAVIDSISPNPAVVGEEITFSGHGEDANTPYGTIRQQIWSYNNGKILYGRNDGSPSSSFTYSDLPAGTYNIHYQVKDYCGAWSPCASMILEVVELPTIEIIAPEDKLEITELTTLDIQVQLNTAIPASKVDYYINDTLEYTDTQPSEVEENVYYSTYCWNVEGLADGVYRIKAVGTTEREHTAETEILVSKGFALIDSPSQEYLEEVIQAQFDNGWSWGSGWQKASSVACDGEYIYLTQYSGGEINFTKIGTGYGDTIAGENYGGCGRRLYGDNGETPSYGTGSITYYTDGYVYQPTDDPYCLVKIDVHADLSSYPDPWPISNIYILDGLINRETGKVEPTLQYGEPPLITSDGTYIYNVSHRIDADVSDRELSGLPPLPGEEYVGYNGWKIRVFDPNNNWALVRELTAGDSSYNTGSVVCDGRFIYPIEWTQTDSARVTRIDVVTGEIYGEWTINQGSTGVRSGQYDWVNNKFWLGDYDGPYLYKYTAKGIVKEEPEQDLIVWYDFEDDFITSGTVKDLSGNGYDAQIIGTVEATDGISGGQAASFSGNGYILAQTNPVAGKNVVSFSLWFKTNSPQNNYKLASAAWWNWGPVSGWILATHMPEFWSDDNKSLYLPGAINNENNFPAGEWVYEVITYDGSRIKEYTNGQLVNDWPATGAPIGSGDCMAIGGWPQFSVYNFVGEIDEFQIYNHAFTADEVQARYEEYITAIPGWELVWHDEFNGDSLDTTKWSIQVHWPWKNGEKQYYVTDAVSVSGGFLIIESEERYYRGYNYTSGRVDTMGKFTIAPDAGETVRIEIRSQLPGTKGIWPAAWLLNENYTYEGDPDWPPEIDIVELRGSIPNTVNMTNHYGRCPNNYYETGSYSGPDFTSDFHTFTLEWEASQIRWYVDGELRFLVSDNVPVIPMYIILNTAVGGYYDGDPDETTVFPQYYYIDYVRVYRKVED